MLYTITRSLYIFVVQKSCTIICSFIPTLRLSCTPREWGRPTVEQHEDKLLCNKFLLSVERRQEMENEQYKYKRERKHLTKVKTFSLRYHFEWLKFPKMYNYIRFNCLCLLLLSFRILQTLTGYKSIVSVLYS